MNYPNFNLKETVCLNGGGIARNQIIDEGPQQNESAQPNEELDEINLVKDPQIMEMRRIQRTKFPSIKLKGYKLY